MPNGLLVIPQWSSSSSAAASSSASPELPPSLFFFLLSYCPLVWPTSFENTRDSELSFSFSFLLECISLLSTAVNSLTFERVNVCAFRQNHIRAVSSGLLNHLGNSKDVTWSLSIISLVLILWFQDGREFRQINLSKTIMNLQHLIDWLIDFHGSWNRA